MSYQVLARKWRPRNFSEVVGQQHVLEALSNALTHQRLHHAYLLTGTRGVGKTTIARILSRSLNCVTGITATPCGECSACVDIEAGRFVDLMEIDAASRTKVEDTREILENVQYRPTSGRYKVYLIDEVHMLSRHSFNALLKTLEEPPPHVIFLLATTDPDKLPITVLSRCLQFHLRALTRNEIEMQLAHILTAENIPYDAAAVQLIARSAQGSMRDALSLTDQAIAQGNQAVQEAKVAAMLGRIDPHNILHMLRDILAGEHQSVLAKVRLLVDQMADISALLPELQNALHQLALAHSATEYLDVEFASLRDEVDALLQVVPPSTWSLFYRLVVEGRKEQPFAPDALTGVEMTVLRMLAFRPDIDTTLLPVFAATETLPEIAKKKPTPPKSLVPQRQPDPAPVETHHPTPAPQIEVAPELQEVPGDKTEPVETVTEQRPVPDVSADFQSLLTTRQQIAARRNTKAPAIEKLPENEGQEELNASEQALPEADAVAKQSEARSEIRYARETDAWSAWVDASGISGLLRQIVLNSVWDQAQGTLLIDESQRTLFNEAMQTTLSNALHEQLAGRELLISFGAPEQTPAQIQQAIDQQRQARAEQRVAEHPELVFLVEQLDGRVSDVQPSDGE